MFHEVLKIHTRLHWNIPYKSCYRYLLSVFSRHYPNVVQTFRHIIFQYHYHVVLLCVPRYIELYLRAQKSFAGAIQLQQLCSKVCFFVWTDTLVQMIVYWCIVDGKWPIDSHISWVMVSKLYAGDAHLKERQFSQERFSVDPKII